LKKDKFDMTETTTLLETLDEQSMTLIDFDSVKSCLGEMSIRTLKYDGLVEDIRTLRDDYTSRVAGMLKALAAVDRKRDSWAQALQLVERLSTMTAAELVACYRKISARFRDAFPASFGSLSERSSGKTLRDLSQFK